MLFQIEGADRTTGEDRTILVDADSDADASNSPEAAKLFISRCLPMDSTADTPMTLPSRGPKVPTYDGITGGSDVLGILGAICYGMGVLLLVVGVFVAASMESGTSLSNAGKVYYLIAALADGVFLIIAGAILRWLASIGIAIRDIAMNSFRQTYAVNKMNTKD